MKLNADIGEMTGNDAEIAPFISMASIACGYHASDAQHMEETVLLTLSAQPTIEIGAHVSYFDKENFGRISLPHSQSEIHELILAQVTGLQNICKRNKTSVVYIKPHGALYHDMMTKASVRNAIEAAAHSLSLPLVVQAESETQWAQKTQWAEKVITESFADRAYHDDGSLVSRAKAHAVHTTPEKIIAQAEQIISTNKVTTESGKVINLKSETLCIHGDNPASITALKQVYALL